MLLLFLPPVLSRLSRQSLHGMLLCTKTQPLWAYIPSFRIKLSRNKDQVAHKATTTIYHMKRRPTRIRYSHLKELPLAKSQARPAPLPSSLTASPNARSTPTSMFSLQRRNRVSHSCHLREKTRLFLPHSSIILFLLPQCE